MQLDILRLINNNDGQLSWYSLDRSLGYEGNNTHQIHLLVKVLRSIEEQGLIISEGEKAQPKYWITGAGKKLLADNGMLNMPSPEVVDHPLYHPDAAKHFPK